jgi:hypothetical protein
VSAECLKPRTICSLYGRDRIYLLHSLRALSVLAMATAAAVLLACAAGPLSRASTPLQRRLLSVPSLPARSGILRGCSLVGAGAGASDRRAQTVQRNATAETMVPYVPGSGKYIAPDYLVVRNSAVRSCRASPRSEVR